jgi:hypothetical protein
MSPSVTYPKPIVFPALGEHKSTLVMLHGLGETLCGLDMRDGSAESVVGMITSKGVKAAAAGAKH